MLGSMSAMTARDGRAKNGYERFVRPLLFSLDPETAHQLTIPLLGSASHFDVALRALRSFAMVADGSGAIPCWGGVVV